MEIQVFSWNEALSCEIKGVKDYRETILMKLNHYEEGLESIPAYVISGIQTSLRVQWASRLYLAVGTCANKVPFLVKLV